MSKIARIATVALVFIASHAGAGDPLPSWNDAAPKKAIAAFIGKISQRGGAEFVPVDQRVAVFDLDGTLIPEKPLPAAVMPLLADLDAAVTKEPSLKQNSAIAALLRGDLGAVAATGEAGQADIIAAVIRGRTTDEVADDLHNAVGTVRDKRYGKTYPDLGYQPMRELLAYLRANEFQIWICSASPVLFMRQFSQSAFGVPPQQVIGTNVETRFVERDGRTVLVYANKIDHMNDKDGKPVAINLAIGRRPLFVGGNVGGFGDVAMMRYSKDRGGPSFQLLLNHDDAAREFAYAEKDGASLAAAEKYGFTVVSIAKDWRTIFGSASSP